MPKSFVVSLDEDIAKSIASQGRKRKPKLPAFQTFVCVALVIGVLRALRQRSHKIDGGPLANARGSVLVVRPA
jgi:hypothetical protein